MASCHSPNSTFITAIISPSVAYAFAASIIEGIILSPFLQHSWIILSDCCTIPSSRLLLNLLIDCTRSSSISAPISKIGISIFSLFFINLFTPTIYSCFSSIKDIPFRLRFSIIVARRVYRKIGHNILKKKNIENYNNSGKIYVTNIGKIIQTILSLYDLIRLSLIKPQDHLRYEEHQTINEEINLNERL